MISIIATVLFVLFTLFYNVAFGKTLYGNRLCRESSDFYCYSIKRGDSWQNLFSDPQQQDIVMRVNRKNTRLWPGMIIAIPKNLDSVDAMTFSPFPRQISPPGEKIILVSLNRLAWGAYDSEGSLVRWGPASGGQGWCPDIGRGCHTSLGRFAIYHKEGAGCVSTKFPVHRGGAPMPYCMFFNGGFALHGSYEVPGYNASHGCVRLFVNDAKWLNQEFTADEGSVPVIIKR